MLTHKTCNKNMEYVLNFGNNLEEANRVVNYLNFESELYNVKAELVGHFPITLAPYKVRFHLDSKGIPLNDFLIDKVKIQNEILDTLVF